MNLPIKNGKIPLKPLAEAIGLSGYQALQRKAKKHGILSGKFIKAENIQKAITLYRDLIVNKYGEGRYRELMDAASFTEPKKKEVVKTDDFSFLGNVRLIMVVAAIAMLMQSIQLTRFLAMMSDIKDLVSWLGIVYLIESLCFQSLVLFLSYRGGLWGRFWVIVFALIDFTVNGFLVNLFTDFRLDKLIATIILPAIIGSLLFLFSSKVKHD